MSESISNQRLAENEVIFREYNENVQKRLDELNAIAAADNQSDVITEMDIPLHFYCECSDEECRERIQMKPKEYNKIHENRTHFIIVPEHNAENIESVIEKQDSYWIVEKRFVPSTEQTDGLNVTDIHNV